MTGRATTDDRQSVVRSPWPVVLLALGIALYTAALTAAAWYKYDTYQMGFDLGVHEQVLWNTAHGRVAATSAFAATESYLGIDIIPTELLLAPLYALAPSARTMLLLQTLALALGAVPAFLIARDRFRQLELSGGRWATGSQFSAWAGLVFAAAYLLYQPVEHMNLYEFQIRAFATTFLLWAFLALERRRFWPFLLWSLLALGCRSEVGLVLAGMGLYALPGCRLPTAGWRGLRSAVGSPHCLGFVLLPIALGLGWFALCLEVLIPAFRGGAPSLYLSVIYGQIDGQPWLGDTPGQIFQTLLTRPGFVLGELFGHSERGPVRLQYLLQMFLPFGFLLLLQPRLLLITLPIFALNLLSNTPNIHASVTKHYQALIIPFMVAGSAYGLHWLLARLRAGPRAQAAALGALLALALLGHLGPHISARGRLAFSSPFYGLLTRPVDRGRIAARARMLALVPPEAALTSSNTLGPHAARRERMFFFPGNVIYPAEKVALGEYLLIDEAELLATADPQERAARERLLAGLRASPGYRLVASEQRLSLWRRVAPPAPGQ